MLMSAGSSSLLRSTSFTVARLLKWSGRKPLAPDDLARLLGAAQALAVWRAGSFAGCFRTCAERCDWPLNCTDVEMPERIWERRLYEHGFVVRAERMEGWFGMLCHTCYARAERVYETRRREVWGSLPEMLQLGDSSWDSLERERICE